MASQMFTETDLIYGFFLGMIFNRSRILDAANLLAAWPGHNGVQPPGISLNSSDITGPSWTHHGAPPPIFRYAPLVPRAMDKGKLHEGRTR